ncbi:MAG: Beta-galactosidase C-terminal domain [Armatimonadetes bacterium]|nr:Beta-galactosidase C-terminal domain [Armatimonadota bacterium]
MASDPEQEFVDGLVAHVCAGQGVKGIVRPEEGVEVTQRTKDGECFTFLLNHGEEGAEVALGGIAGRDLLSGEEVAGTVRIPAGGVRIIRGGR